MKIDIKKVLPANQVAQNVSYEDEIWLINQVKVIY